MPPVLSCERSGLVAWTDADPGKGDALKLRSQQTSLLFGHPLHPPTQTRAEEREGVVFLHSSRKEREEVAYSGCRKRCSPLRERSSRRVSLQQLRGKRSISVRLRCWYQGTKLWFAVYPVSSYMCDKGTGMMGVELGDEILSMLNFCARNSLKLFQLS